MLSYVFSASYSKKPQRFPQLKSRITAKTTRPAEISMSLSQTYQYENPICMQIEEKLNAFKL